MFIYKIRNLFSNIASAHIAFYFSLLITSIEFAQSSVLSEIDDLPPHLSVLLLSTVDTLNTSYSVIGVNAVESEHYAFLAIDEEYTENPIITQRVVSAYLALKRTIQIIKSEGSRAVETICSFSFLKELNDFFLFSHEAPRLLYQQSHIPVTYPYTPLSKVALKEIGTERLKIHCKAKPYELSFAVQFRDIQTGNDLFVPVTNNNIHKLTTILSQIPEEEKAAICKALENWCHEQIQEQASCFLCSYSGKLISRPELSRSGLVIKSSLAGLIEPFGNSCFGSSNGIFCTYKDGDHCCFTSETYFGYETEDEEYVIPRCTKDGSHCRLRDFYMPDLFYLTVNKHYVVELATSVLTDFHERLREADTHRKKLAAIAKHVHHMMMIHPFQDHNNCTIRIWCQGLLLSLGMHPFIAESFEFLFLTTKQLQNQIENWQERYERLMARYKERDSEDDFQRWLCLFYKQLTPEFTALIDQTLLQDPRVQQQEY
ncbi:hypothetical protein ACWJJH_11355 [Endozoicomonadaceae bacterium StTr2]